MIATRALLLGRFQPPHRGHVRAIEHARRTYGEVIVAVGSSQESHTRANPFTCGERFDLLRAALAPLRRAEIHLYPLPDLHRHAAWVRHCEALLPPFDVVVTRNPLTRRLFRAAGYRVDAEREWKREAWQGLVIRRRIARGASVDDELPPGVRDALERIDGLRRIRELEARAHAR